MRSDTCLCHSAREEEGIHSRSSLAMWWTWGQPGVPVTLLQNQQTERIYKTCSLFCKYSYILRERKLIAVKYKYVFVSIDVPKSEGSSCTHCGRREEYSPKQMPLCWHFGYSGNTFQIRQKKSGKTGHCARVAPQHLLPCGIWARGS